jgi:hypothetical protein
MEASRRQQWIPAILLLGVAYFLIGRVFAVPANHVRAWRLAAWVVSGAVYAAHIGYEHLRLRHPPREMALHAALAVALGAFGLAVAGMLHSQSPGSAIRPSWLLALVLFPAITAIPAFLVAFVAGTLLTRLPRRSGTD